jgi:hypothetical protein
MRCSATFIYFFNLCVAPVRQQLGCGCDVNNPRLRRRHLYWPTLWCIGATSVFAAWRRCLRYVLLVDVRAGFFHQRQHVDTSVNCSPDRLFSRFGFARSLRTAACAIKYQPIQTGMSAPGRPKLVHRAKVLKGDGASGTRSKRTPSKGNPLAQRHQRRAGP